MRKLINDLNKTKSESWKKVAKKLSSPRRNKVEVNVGEINMHAKDGETIVVPGIVLANGKLEKGLTIAAWRFTGAASEKIVKAKGKTLSIEDLAKENPKGSKIRIMV